MSAYKKRRKGIRKQRRIMVIVCEGKKTEMNYFKGFKTRYSNLNIIPLHGKCTDPKNIVWFAKEQIKEYRLKLNQGDGLWCAFDVDDSTDEEIKIAKDNANKYNIIVALSNPSLELWYLLHFENILSNITRHEVEERLKNFIPDYTKSKIINHILENKLIIAIDRAKKLNEKHENDEIQLFSRLSNPSSQVFQLIEFIKKITEKNKG